ncbi:hypothetical protein [Ulvibacterium sp.]|uniref:hypothetical protein n=1 Tax=Ulvibacterium sp. TaxID=2665914 RepID=UPI002612B7A4|nr:hypothetical protein [Ulvibacterium sp.]
MKKFTFEQIQAKVGSLDKEFVEKVFLLTNGMIEVHGFERETAYHSALEIASSWLMNGKSYFPKSKG